MDEFERIHLEIHGLPYINLICKCSDAIDQLLRRKPVFFFHFKWGWFGFGLLDTRVQNWSVHIFHHHVRYVQLPERQLCTVVPLSCVWEEVWRRRSPSPHLQRRKQIICSLSPITAVHVLIPSEGGADNYSQGLNSSSYKVFLSASAAGKTRVFLCSSQPSISSCMCVEGVSRTLCRIYNAWLQVDDVFILACWINTAGWFFAGDRGAGIWDVDGCGSPAEQPPSAAASPAAEVKPGNQCLREPWIFFAFTTHEVLFHQGRSCTERESERAHLRHTSHCARKTPFVS